MMCMRQRVGENVLPYRIQNGKKSALIRVLKHIECSSKRSVFCFFKKIDDFIEIYSIFVVPEYRNKGVAKNFLDCCLKYCKRVNLIIYYSTF